MTHQPLAFRPIIGWLALAGAGLMVACGPQQNATTDQATVDRGNYRNPPGPAPDTTAVTLPNGATISATPAVAELAAYLASDRPAGETFDLPSIRFVQAGEVRSDPDGALNAIATVIKVNPKAQVRIEVVQRSPQSELPDPAAAQRAEHVRDALVENGLPPQQVIAAGVKDAAADQPRVRLVVTRK